MLGCQLKVVVAATYRLMWLMPCQANVVVIVLGNVVKAIVSIGSCNCARLMW